MHGTYDCKVIRSTTRRSVLADYRTISPCCAPMCCVGWGDWATRGSRARAAVMNHYFFSFWIVNQKICYGKMWWWELLRLSFLFRCSNPTLHELGVVCPLLWAFLMGKDKRGGNIFHFCELSWPIKNTRIWLDLLIRKMPNQNTPHVHPIIIIIIFFSTSIHSHERWLFGVPGALTRCAPEISFAAHLFRSHVFGAGVYTNVEWRRLLKYHVTVF